MTQKANLLTVVEAANTGVLAWETVGPWVQTLIERNALENIPITHEDLVKDSIVLGTDLSNLQAAIDKQQSYTGDAGAKI